MTLERLAEYRRRAQDGYWWPKAMLALREALDEIERLEKELTKAKALFGRFPGDYHDVLRAAHEHNALVEQLAALEAELVASREANKMAVRACSCFKGERDRLAEAHTQLWADYEATAWMLAEHLGWATRD